jgi:two-component system, cell cycle sensor histidine kinase and response regulator CckA
MPRMPDDSLFLDSIVENIPDMIFVKEGLELRFVRFNSAGERLLGISREEMYGKNDYDFFPDDEAAFFQQKDREVLEGGEVVDIPYEPIHTADGLRWLHTRKVPILDERGRPRYLLGISTDVTQRHTAQQQLRAVLDNFPGAVWEVGAEVTRIAGEPLLEDADLKALAQRGEDFERTVGDLSFEGKVEPLQSGGHLVVALDVTERRRLEAERMQAQMRELQRMESLGMLAGGIAHDFNNLLVGMLGNASLALEDVAEDHPARKALERVEGAARRASDLSRQMLAYSGRGHFVVRRVDLAETIEKLADLLRAGIHKGVDLHVSIPADLPPVSVDVTQFHQLLMNLITNASDAIGEAGGNVTVRAQSVAIDKGFQSESWLERDLRPGDYVALSVTDDGCGMNEQTIARMFDPFYTTKATGHGLGLAAALGIVRGHNGSLQVESTEGKGTTIRMLLPSPLGPTTSEAVSAPSTRTGQDGGRVLIVDDEEAVREFASAALEHHGFTVLTANCGEDALAMDGPFDVVVLDLTMPGMSGVETLRAMRERWPDQPAVLSSGYDQAEATRTMGDLQLQSFLQKPYSLRDLVNHVRGALP